MLFVLGIFPSGAVAASSEWRREEGRLSAARSDVE